MAKKKTTDEAVEAASALEDTIPTGEENAPDTMETESPAPAEDTSPEREEDSKPEESAGAAEKITLVYIGPSIPYEKLRTSMILKGTEAEMKTFLGDLTERYPEIPHLLVSPEKLSEEMDKVARKGTILYKYYGDMLAKTRVSRKG